MNERIRELIEKAEDPEHGFIIPEKFAELMIEQFDRILVNEYLDCVGENDKKSQFRIDRLRNRIKEYFGVEE